MYFCQVNISVWFGEVEPKSNKIIEWSEENLETSFMHEYV